MPELAGYDFTRSLGEGAMGPVYLARQTSHDREVAVKQILGLWNGDPEVLAGFQRETEALERLDHPNIAGIYELTTDGTDLFLVTEYLPGPSLRRLMEIAPLTKPQALSVISDVASALEYAGQRSIIHGDLKPANIFVTASGVSKVGDFGLVKMLAGQASSGAQHAPILGTPAYISPEQAASRPGVDGRSDIYSLAVIAYELLVGRLPFPSVPGDVEATIDAHLSAPVPRPVSIVLGFPMQAQDVLLGGLSKQPYERPASAREFWRQLSAAAEIAWPDWAAESDLAAIAAAATPSTPAPIAEPAPSPAAEPIFAPTMADEAAAPSVTSPAPPTPAFTPLWEEPEPHRRSAAPWLALLVLLAAVGVAGVVGVTQLQVLGGGKPLVVSAVSATVSPTTGHCPSAHYRFTAKVANNGEGGPVTYKWTKPDQKDTEITSASIPSGQKEASAQFDFTFQGQGGTEGDAVLHILTPNDVRSTPIHISYNCP